jgi:hypothetical protein
VRTDEETVFVRNYFPVKLRAMFIFKATNIRNHFFMKKFLFSSLFAACAAMGLSACMNGDYDATPNSNNASPNPLANSGNGGGGGGTGGGGGSIGTAAKGEIRCVVNGSNLIITNAKWQSIIGRGISGNLTTGTLDKAISMLMASYSGPNTYTIIGGADVSASYTLSDYTGPSIKNYSTTTAPGGTGQIVVTSDANNEMQGTFNFTGYYNSEQVTVTNGSFWATQ